MSKYKSAQPDWDGLGAFVYKRTYSRTKPDGSSEEWWETVRRVVEGTYNMQKKWIYGNRLPWREGKAQYSAQEMFARIFDMKFLPPGRGLWAMGTAITEERNLYAALNNCFAGTERFLTKEGYKTFAETVGTNQTVLTENGEWISVPVREFGTQKIYELTLSRQGVEKTIRTTDNHRWFYKTKSDLAHAKGWQIGTTTTLKEGDRLRYNFGHTVKNPSPHGIVAGFTFGDGTKGRIDLQKGKDEALLPYLTSFRTLEHDSFYSVYDIPVHYKNLPEKTWDRKYLFVWLMGYFAADGSVSKAGQVTISSSKKENLEFYKEVLAICGIGTYSLLQDTSVSTNFSGHRNLYKLTLIPATIPHNFFILQKHQDNFKQNTTLRYWHVKDIKETTTQEPVYCVQVPKKESFTLEDSIFTLNCAFISTADIKSELAQPFAFLMDASMLGVGVGFDTKGAGAIVVKGCTQNAPSYTIPDTREGWVESVSMLIEAMLTGGSMPVFDYSAIRPAGAPIKGFGGVSAGFKPLQDLHDGIVTTLNRNVGAPITVRTIVDIMNLIGKAVVAGNVRRTAEIVFGEPTDEYLDLKNYNVNPDRADYGWTSNNAIYAELGMDYEASAARTRINGEPGFAWLENMQGYSRMNNGKDNKDHRATGGNPCLEQTLESWEMCCLVETFPTRHESKEDFLRTLKFAYLYAKTVTLGQTHWPETNRVMLRNRRIGCSVSGVAQFVTNRGLHVLRDWLEDGYNTIQYWDSIYSDWMAVPRSIKTTSVKPSGTVSLLAGVTPGVHYPESRHYIRRIRVAKNSPLLQPMIDAGYRVEDAVGDPYTAVIEFPVNIGDDMRVLSDVSMWEQLALAAFMQKYWADNQVSCTITFTPTEGEQIASALNYYQYQLKGVSFLPKLEKATYPQMPYEAIDKDTYNKMVSGITMPIFASGVDGIGEKFCNNDVCQI